VPPPGAKGLNLAVSDVVFLSRALCAFYADRRPDLLEAYSETALRRVWNAVRPSWWLTTLLHVFPGEDSFQAKIRYNEFDYLTRSEHAQATLAEQFVGLPF
jgi:p-hydroxybenzoate 3-monooxygenase